MSFAGSSKAAINLSNHYFIMGFSSWAMRNHVDEAKCKFKFIKESKILFMKREIVKIVNATDTEQIARLSGSSFTAKEVLDENDNVIFTREMYRASGEEPLWM